MFFFLHRTAEYLSVSQRPRGMPSERKKQRASATAVTEFSTFKEELCLAQFTAGRQHHGTTHPMGAGKASFLQLEEVIGILQRSLALRPVRPRGLNVSPSQCFVSGFPKRSHLAMCRMRIGLIWQISAAQFGQNAHVFTSPMSTIWRYGRCVHRALAELWLKRWSHPRSQDGFIPLADNTCITGRLVLD